MQACFRGPAPQQPRLWASIAALSPGCGAQEVLVNPEHGYYVSREAIGREGDFTTSPEVSQLMGEVRPRRFLRPATLPHSGLLCCTPSSCPPQQAVAQMVGVWAAAAWQAAGSPARVRLVELGPGRGTLMADLLRGTSSLRAFAAAVEVDLVEARMPSLPLACLLLCFRCRRGARLRHGRPGVQAHPGPCPRR